MPSPDRKPTRRAALTALGGLPLAASAGAAAQPAPFAPHEAEIPVRGKAGPGLEAFDAAIIAVMERHGIPGATLAVAKDGRLVLAKGYGWADTKTGAPAEPDMSFGVASLSKSITAVAVLKLVEQGKLGLDDKVFARLKHIKPPAGGRANPALADVTVRQCLNHSGGWDRGKSGDPVNWEPQICRAMRLRPPLSPAQFVSFMLTAPLDFRPGTDVKYSNVGYMILGEVIAAVSGQKYEPFVTETVLKPMGLKTARVTPRGGKYPDRTAHRHLAGSLVPLPPLQLPMVEAAGGWMASAVDMVRFLTNLDGSRGEPVLGEQARGWMVERPQPPLMPRPDGTHVGLGWDAMIPGEKAVGYFKDGSYQGMRTYMKRLPNGSNWALLFNASLEIDSTDFGVIRQAVQEVRAHVEALKKYPDVDLFKDFE